MKAQDLFSLIDADLPLMDFDFITLLTEFSLIVSGGASTFLLVLAIRQRQALLEASNRIPWDAVGLKVKFLHLDIEHGIQSCFIDESREVWR